MSFLESFFLGALQGIAEFLPISSSGHLAVAKALLHLREVPLLYDVILHFATLCAIILVYHKTIGRLIVVACRFIVRKNTPNDKDDLYFIRAVCVASAFTAVIGFLLKDIVEQLPVNIISLLFIVTGVVLILGDKVDFRKVQNQAQSGISLKSACIVGIVQGAAVFPGISRSGSTITAGLVSQIDRKRVAEFSFILSIPAIVGALILELHGGNAVVGVGTGQLIVGFVTAFVVGVFSLKLLTKLLEKAKLKIFSYYLIPLGIILFCCFTFLN